MGKSSAFIACLIYDLIITSIIFYLIAFMGWSKWTYVLAMLNGAGLMTFFYRTFDIKELEKE